MSELRFTATFDRRQMTTLLRASPQVNQARWRTWAILTGVLTGFVTLLGSLGASLDPASLLARTGIDAVLLGAVFFLLVVANPWWLPRLAPRRALVGMPTHWRLDEAAATATGERGASVFPWDRVAAVLEKDGLLVLVTKTPRRLIGLPLAQLSGEDVAVIRQWIDDAEERPAATATEARSDGGISTLAAPFTRAQTLTIATTLSRGLSIGGVVLVVFGTLGGAMSISTGRPASEILQSMVPILAGPVVGLVIWATSRQLLKTQYLVGPWTFDGNGISSPSPLGAHFTPWSQIRRLTIRRGIVLARLGYARSTLAMPITGLSGNDVEQILSWAAAGGVQTRN